MTHKPILYLGIGQGYGDLEEFDHDRFLDSIFKDRVYEKTSKDLTLGGISSIDDIGKKEKNKKENKTKSESENGKEKNGVVYLTDDDINDLIK